MAKDKRSTGTSARERRRQRRVRNQTLAYATLGVLLICLAAGLFFVGRLVTTWIGDWRQEREFSRQMEALSSADSGEVETEEVETQESVEAYTEDDLLDEMIDTSIAAMPLEDQVAGLFLTTPEALTGVDQATKAGDGTEEALAEYPVGGIVYAASNIQSEEQFSQMLQDTISRSKYALFLILDDETNALPQDLSVYGINMEFVGKGEDGEVSFRTVTLPSLLGNAKEDGLVTAQIAGEEDSLADACLDAWKGGASLLYVQDGFQNAYTGMLEVVRGDSDLEGKVRDTLETVYGVKYRNQMGQEP